MTSDVDIFVSYSHRDSGIATELVSRLKKAGLKCFLAEKDIAAGEEWEPKIRDALYAAKRVLLLITPRSKNSLWVAAEAGAAWALKKHLIAALMFVEAHELIEPIRKHQARLVETAEQVDALVKDLLPRATHVVDTSTISGQWADPWDGDVAFFKQTASSVVGFYDYGTGTQKVGIYIGTLKNRVFDYRWRWLNGQYQGHGRMILAPNGNRLEGNW